MRKLCVHTNMHAYMHISFNCNSGTHIIFRKTVGSEIISIEPDYNQGLEQNNIYEVNADHVIIFGLFSRNRFFI